MPPARSRLFGRQDEIAQVRRRLEDGVRLVTITGAGGIGKTRIAVEVGRQVSGKVSFLELSGIDDAGLPGALVRALVPEPGTGQDPVAAIAGALAGQPRVVVLDTFERLLASVGLLDDLLEACPELQLLVTSRSRLRISGENVVPVGALPAGADGAAGAMFYERARAVGGLREPGPDDQPADDQRDVVVALCQLLDGSPLAIELASARTTMFTPAALLAALRSAGQSRLGMLAGGGAPGRHRDMRSTIAWSYRLLDAPAQRLLRRLAVFAGSFDLDAAARAGPEPAGAPGADVPDDLGDLGDWHLGGPGGGAGAPWSSGSGSSRWTGRAGPRASGCSTCCGSSPPSNSAPAVRSAPRRTACWTGAWISPNAPSPAPTPRPSGTGWSASTPSCRISGPPWTSGPSEWIRRPARGSRRRSRRSGPTGAR